MRRHGAVDSEWVAPHPVSRRTAESAGSGSATSVLLRLQRSAGNAAVAGHLGPTGGGVRAGSPMAFVQRCGPTPCDCSPQERADYAEQHPDEPAAPDVDDGGAGHRHD